MPDDSKTVTLYLTEWQKRMMKDYMPVSTKKAASLSRASKIKISIIDKKQWVMYRQPIDALKAGAWNLYLTDEQIARVSAELGIRAKFSALNISPEVLESGAIAFQ